MSGLILQLLGTFGATLDGAPLPAFRTKKVQALLIYLACQPEPQARGNLMTLLWPDLPQASAQDNLRQTLYQLRRAVPQCASAAELLAELTD